MSQELFALIRSLDPETKNMLRRRADAGGRQPRFFMLFDAYDSLPAYDEKALRLKLREAGSIRNLTEARKNLLQFILETLESREINPRKQIRHLVNRYELLHQKGFRELAREQLIEAENIARSNDLYIQLTEVLILRLHVEGELAMPETADQAILQIKHIHNSLNELAELNKQVWVIVCIYKLNVVSKVGICKPRKKKRPRLVRIW